ncbi:hypothetical protein [Massilibacteroides sp.]|uniref:hypothetical protein n=1 Tax=Massilibacteroides sp. TaxID=2034766 RepID=UPI002603B508|nr:hypothetical protein [Massilibacteroides sp.]MDD4516575.1 hypothetical protein [Massilibacteroides sp.]
MKKIILLLIAVIAAVSLLVACETETSTYKQQAVKNEENARTVTQQYSFPKVDRSLDYENVIRRVEYLNQGNNIGYLYLLTDTGAVIEEVQVLGKVTSLNTYITPMEESQVARHRIAGTYDSAIIVVSAPDIDGTYGDNVSGIFWFTPDGTYGEWNGKFRFSSTRLTFQTEPIMIENLAS